MCILQKPQHSNWQQILHIPAPQDSQCASYTRTAKPQSKGSVNPTNNLGKESSLLPSTRSNCLPRQGTCALRSNGYQAIKDIIGNGTANKATKQAVKSNREDTTIPESTHKPLRCTRGSGIE